MVDKSIEKVAVVIPNLNGEAYLASAIDSLLHQDFTPSIVVVENASTDKSLEILRSYGDKIHVIQNAKNLGFAGGVNTGIRWALDQDFDAIALFNNDAIAHADWLTNLIDAMNKHPDAGIVTCQIRLGDSKLLDSTGEFYTSWGLPYPRGREKPVDSFMNAEYVFGASGGASLYRKQLFAEIGLFDETFFAYYEDTDISFRAQLAGWKVFYEPGAIVDHRQGETSKKMVKGFTVYQTFKNLPILFGKNVPTKLLPSIGVRFWLAYNLIFLNAIAHGKGLPAIKGFLMSLILLPHTIRQRRFIQHRKKATATYIDGIIVHDLPPDQTGIRKLRKVFLGK